ncbi:hypothetical protein N7468_009861 [Penicillium chermesinum]|uniref:Uncharacterized protein n=1 Tax=Penicillium chermesinum TaxID=63820 RepID=A0A9W9NBL5_9EURO|nr:uncharacterized protein N7468_009861 [Penicillium chermesinum]KAJ5216853.1 hypothetical protein N7468_009861 [Penicillium chermesinum]
MFTPPVERLVVLDEIYMVREQEEKYLAGKASMDTYVLVDIARYPVSLKTSEATTAATISASEWDQ